MINAHKMLLRKSGDLLGDIGVQGRIISECILKKESIKE
jgi:hypothetical protein